MSGNNSEKSGCGGDCDCAPCQSGRTRSERGAGARIEPSRAAVSVAHWKRACATEATRTSRSRSSEPTRVPRGDHGNPGHGGHGPGRPHGPHRPGHPPGHEPELPPSTGRPSEFPLRTPPRGPIDDIQAPPPYHPPPTPIPPWQPGGFARDCHIERPPTPTGERNPELPPPVGGIVSRREIVDPPGGHQLGLASRGGRGGRPQSGPRGPISSREYSRNVRSSVSGTPERSWSIADLSADHLDQGLAVQEFSGGDLGHSIQPQSLPAAAVRALVPLRTAPRNAGALAFAGDPPLHTAPSFRGALTGIRQDSAPTLVPPAWQQIVGTRGLLQGGRSNSGLPSSPAAPVDLLGPEKPLCPKNYEFDYDWQSCWPANIPHRRPRAGELWSHACTCPPGYSYLATERDCWQRGSVPFSVWGIGGGHGFAREEATGLSCNGFFMPACTESMEGLLTIWIYPKYCTEEQEQAIRLACFIAKDVAQTAARFMEHVYTASPEVRAFLWTFGDIEGNALTPQTFDRSPAPSYWFGPYRLGTSRPRTSCCSAGCRPPRAWLLLFEHRYLPVPLSLRQPDLLSRGDGNALG